MTITELIAWLSEQEPSHEVYVWNEVAKEERLIDPRLDIDTDHKTGRIVIDGQFQPVSNPYKFGRDLGLLHRLKEACVGRPCAKIPWPHRLLHEAHDEIQSLQALIPGAGEKNDNR